MIEVQESLLLNQIVFCNLKEVLNQVQLKSYCNKNLLNLLLKLNIQLLGNIVFDLPENTELIIETIEYMYQSIGVSTKLKDYNVDDKVIENITGALKKHGMSEIGEKGNLTLDKVALILENSLR